MEENKRLSSVITLSQDNTTYIQRIDSLEKDLQHLQGNNNNQLLSMQSQMSQSNSVVTVRYYPLLVDSLELGAAAGAGKGTDYGVGGEHQGQERHAGAAHGGRERETPRHHHVVAGGVGEVRPGRTVLLRTGGLLPVGPGGEYPSIAADSESEERERPDEPEWHGVLLPAVQRVPVQPV